LGDRIKRFTEGEDRKQVAEQLIEQYRADAYDANAYHVRKEFQFTRPVSLIKGRKNHEY
jgi:hypothetical protein